MENKSDVRKLIGKKVEVCVPRYPLLLMTGFLKETTYEEANEVLGQAFCLDDEDSKLYHVVVKNSPVLFFFKEENVDELNSDVDLGLINLDY